MKRWCLDLAATYAVWFCGGLLFAWGTAATAGLTWETTQLELQAEPKADRVEGVFRFTNAGDEALTIYSVAVTCGCTTAELKQKVYAPGDSGQIEVVFMPGDRIGTQNKNIIVRTSDGAKPVTILRMRVELPGLVQVAPRLLIWKAEEDREPKVVEVVFHEIHPVVVTGIEVGDAAVEVELEEVEKGRHYRVMVRPTNDEALGVVVKLVTGRDEAVDEASPLRFMVRAAAQGAQADRPPASRNGATDASSDEAIGPAEQQGVTAD